MYHGPLHSTSSIKTKSARLLTPRLSLLCHLIGPLTRALLILRSTQVVAQVARAAGMAQTTQGLALDLADTFAGQAEFLADFFKCIAAPVLQAETKTQDAGLTRREGC